MFWSSKHFEFSDIPDLTGKIALITGASAGIGKVSALEMARKNCHIIFACRSKEKTLAVMEEIQKETGNNKLEFIQVDLISLQSVQNFIKEVKSKHTEINILMNNAGLFGPFPSTSEDGLESQFAINYLSHFYLTTQLLPLLRRNSSTPSRIINLSSAAHLFTFGSLDFEKFNRPEHHGSINGYGVSKSAVNLFTVELSRRLEELGEKNVYANVCHPGIVKTDIPRHYIQIDKTFLLNSYFFLTNSVSPELGALTQLYLATSPEIEEKNYKGQYFVPYAKLSKASKKSTDLDTALKLWKYSEEILKEKIPDYQGAGI